MRIPASIITIVLLIISNAIMSLAWYGHLRFKDMGWFQNAGLMLTILISWGIAFFEYSFMIPANKIGYQGNGGPFSLLQLKMLQEVISILVFFLMVKVLFQHETIHWNHMFGFIFILIGVYFFMK